jgi:hypothetical protein
MRIELQVERLVLDEALLGGERAMDVRQAIEQELARLLTSPGAFDTLRAIGSVASLPATTLPPAIHPHTRLGARIATAVQRGLGDGVTSTPAVRGQGVRR